LAFFRNQRLTATPTTSAPAPPLTPGTIQVRVKELTQLFNSIDPSPFREKDLDDDASEFIIGWAREVPANEPLTLLVHLDKGALPPNAVETLTEAVHQFFGHRSELTQQRLRELLRLGRTSLFIGLLFLAGCIVVSDRITRSFPNAEFGDIVRESLIIGGWVAMWRPIEIFLYDWWPILRERKIFDRLSQMRVVILCSQ
jgi:hypothetical protein